VYIGFGGVGGGVRERDKGHARDYLVASLRVNTLQVQTRHCTLIT